MIRAINKHEYICDKGAQTNSQCVNRQLKDTLGLPPGWSEVSWNGYASKHFCPEHSTMLLAYMITSPT